MMVMERSYVFCIYMYVYLPSGGIFSFASSELEECHIVMIAWLSSIIASCKAGDQYKPNEGRHNELQQHPGQTDTHKDIVRSMKSH